MKLKLFRFTAFMLILVLCLGDSVLAMSRDTDTQGLVTQAAAENADLNITAASAVLMEASTGLCIYEKEADQSLPPASITKIMTLILIFDALDKGSIKLEDMVTTSAYASSMGGSQVFLEEGEQQTVDTMIKCICVASANDASVAMAEYLAGSEAEFVSQMNQRAEGLGMTSTHFEDCCGLTESEKHLTSARDVALMSRELITKYPQISEYSTIWMENITHTTSKGSKEFGLSNTNKLLKMNNSFTVTGLKTGSTSRAKYCLSATANKDGIDLIAVVMAAPDYKARFAQAQTLLNYGYAVCTTYEDTAGLEITQLPVRSGKQEQVGLALTEQFRTIGMEGEDFSNVEREFQLPEVLNAPVNEGDVVGSVVYKLDGKVLGSVDIVTTESVEAAGYMDYLEQMWQYFIRKSD